MSLVLDGYKNKNADGSKNILITLTVDGHIHDIW